jgi:hypothetical protein
LRVRNSSTRSVPAQCVEPIITVAIAACDQLDAAEDERSHEDVAQLGIGLDEPEQLFAIELDHLARFNRANPRQGSAAGPHGAFAGELAGAPAADLEPQRWSGEVPRTG